MPQTTDVIASKLGVGRGVDVVIYVSLMVLFYVVFRLFIKIEEVEREITTLVRKLAIDDGGRSIENKSTQEGTDEKSL